MRLTVPLRFAALIVFAAVVGGCGNSGSSEPVTAPPPSIGPSEAGPTGSAAGSASPTPSMRLADPQPSGPIVVLHGTVADGVEPGCVLLNTDSKAYLLIGGDRAALKSGAKLTVHGVPQPDLMTTCQQGTPFRVTKIEP
jgi:hypothetical protein